MSASASKAVPGVHMAVPAVGVVRDRSSERFRRTRRRPPAVAKGWQPSAPAVSPVATVHPPLRPSHANARARQGCEPRMPRMLAAVAAIAMAAVTMAAMVVVPARIEMASADASASAASRPVALETPAKPDNR